MRHPLIVALVVLCIGLIFVSEAAAGKRRSSRSAKQKTVKAGSVEDKVGTSSDVTKVVNRIPAGAVTSAPPVKSAAAGATKGLPPITRNGVPVQPMAKGPTGAAKAATPPAVTRMPAGPLKTPPPGTAKTAATPAKPGTPGTTNAALPGTAKAAPTGAAKPGATGTPVRPLTQ